MSSFKVGVLVVSDRAVSGERPDQCLPVFRSLLDGPRFRITEARLCSDEPSDIRAALESMLNSNPDLIFTSGGTGCGPRDNTPEIIRKLIDKPTPGVDEAIRRFSSEKSDFAIYSRSLSGVAASTFLVSLPGSPKAVAEILGLLLPTIDHPLKLIAGQISDCDREKPRHD